MGWIWDVSCDIYIVQLNEEIVFKWIKGPSFQSRICKLHPWSGFGRWHGLELWLTARWNHALPNLSRLASVMMLCFYSRLNARLFYSFDHSLPHSLAHSFTHSFTLPSRPHNNSLNVFYFLVKCSIPFMFELKHPSHAICQLLCNDWHWWIIFSVSLTIKIKQFQVRWQQHQH